LKIEQMFVFAETVVCFS